MGGYQKILDLAPSVVDMLEKTNKKSDFFGKQFNAYSIGCLYWGYSSAMLGNFEEGEALLEKALRYAIEINHSPTLGSVETFYGFLYAFKGDGKNTVKHFENSIRYLEKGQVVILYGIARAGLGYGYYFLGQLEEARSHVEKGLSLHLGRGMPALASAIHFELGLICYDLRDLKSAQTSIEKALELSQQTNERQHEGLAWELLGRVLGKSDPQQIDKAEEYILNGIRIHEDLKLKPLYSLGYFFLGELYTDTGQREKVLENLKKAEGMFKEMGMDYWLRKTQEVLGRLQT
jgi:tetratricopeptide (TPR) repeat protein